MVNKIIADYLKTNKRLVVPQFGAFLHKDDGTVAFVPFLKKDDGVLIQLIGSAYGLNPGDAQAAIEEFTAEIKKNIAARGAYIIEGIGTLKIDSNSIYYLDSGQKAAQAIPAPLPGCRRTRILASGSSTATAPGAYDRPSGRKTATGRPAEAGDRATDGCRAATSIRIPPRRSVPQPTQQRPVQQQTPPHPGNPVRQTPPGAASSQPRSATALSTADAERRQPASDEPEAATARLSAQAAAARTAGSKEIESGRFYRHRHHHRHHRARRDDLRFSGKSRRPRHPVDHPACTDRYRDRTKRARSGQRLVRTKNTCAGTPFRTPAQATYLNENGVNDHKTTFRDHR